MFKHGNVQFSEDMAISSSTTSDDIISLVLCRRLRCCNKKGRGMKDPGHPNRRWPTFHLKLDIPAAAVSDTGQRSTVCLFANRICLCSAPQSHVVSLSRRESRLSRITENPDRRDGLVPHGDLWMQTHTSAHQSQSSGIHYSNLNCPIHLVCE